MYSWLTTRAELSSLYITFAAETIWSINRDGGEDTQLRHLLLKALPRDHIA